jgi:hypothetical protein
MRTTVGVRAAAAVTGAFVNSFDAVRGVLRQQEHKLHKERLRIQQLAEDNLGLQVSAKDEVAAATTQGLRIAIRCVSRVTACCSHCSCSRRRSK